jgi:hypothetical protein
MLETVEGVFREGRVELLEAPPDRDEARVIVTFLPSAAQKQTPTLTVAEAAALRTRLQSFAEGWNRPDMDVYDAL